MSFELSRETFERRASILVKALKTHDEGYEALNGLAAIVIPVGAIPDEATAVKSTALQTWLLGYEFLHTLIVITRDGKFIFLGSETKAALLRGLQGGSIDVEVVVKPKDKDIQGSATACETVVAKIKALGHTIGVVTKDKYEGKFIDAWSAACKKGGGFEEVDVAPALACAMVIKESTELASIDTASKILAHLSQFMKTEIISCLRNQKKTSHERLAELVEQKMDRVDDESSDPKDPKFWQKMTGFSDLDLASADISYSPIIQSSSTTYDVKPSAQSDAKILKKGVVLGSMGIRYNAYNANIGRTLLLDATKEQSANYLILLELQDYLLPFMKSGNTFSQIYELATNFVKGKNSNLLPFLPKSLGFVTGIEYRESAYLVSAKNTKKMKANMVVILTLALQSVTQTKGKDYSLLLSDTVKVGPETGVLLTDFVRDIADISETFENTNGDSQKKSSQSKQGRTSESAREEVINRIRSPMKSVGRLRNRSTRVITENTSKKIAAHQAELHASRQKAGLEKYAGANADGDDGEEAKTFKKYESYRNESKLPSSIHDDRITVHGHAQSVIIPINGQAVPYHINSIKNAVKTDDGEYTTIRINFNSPGQLAGRKEDVVLEDPDATFIRSVTFRSLDNFRFTELTKEINDMKKNALKKVAEQKNLADVVEQDRLIETKRPHRLHDVLLKNPGLEGKKGSGSLEIHANGIRYQGQQRADHKVDILFSNIKHLFFQPCEGELIVIIHVTLKTPVMIGKRKAHDIQVFREASEAAFDETGNRKRRPRYGDEDEIGSEQEERRRRRQIDHEFKTFAEKIAQSSEDAFEVDIPFRELGFNGVTSAKSNVLMQPTTDCLVHLTEFPCTVITLSEVEVAHLERVTQGIKHFDLVFVFSDFKKAPTHINTIPMKQLDNVKEWLDSVDIPVSEGPLNLSWPQIMKVVNEDPLGFFEEGGWAFLQSAEDGSSESEGNDDVFEIDSDEDALSSESSEDYDESASDDSAISEEGSSGGEDWSDLEKEAAQDDEEAGMSDEDRDRRKGKSKSRR